MKKDDSHPIYCHWNIFNLSLYTLTWCFYKLIIFIWWHGWYGFYFGQQIADCSGLFLRFLLFLFWLWTLVWLLHKIRERNYFLLQKTLGSVAYTAKKEGKKTIMCLSFGLELDGMLVLHMSRTEMDVFVLRGLLSPNTILVSIIWWLDIPPEAEIPSPQ